MGGSAHAATPSDVVGRLREAAARATIETPITPTMIPSDQADREVAAEELVEERHLAADEDQHDAEAVLQHVELVDGAPQHEVEVAQAQDGEDVRGEDDERLAGQARRWPAPSRPRTRCRSSPGRAARRRAASRAAGPSLHHEEAAGRDMVSVTGTNRRKSRMSAFSSGSTSLSVGEHHADAGEDEEGAEEPDHPGEAAAARRPSAMKIARKISAPRMPKKSTRCCRTRRARRSS